MKFKSGLACMALVLVSACSTFHPKSNEEAVMARAEQRQEALKKAEYEKAYSFMSPTYKASHTLDRFKATVGRGAAMMVDSKVTSAQCDEDACTVLVDANYKFLDKGSMIPMKPLLVPRTNNERWIKVDGEWWFIKLD
ncbi:hypothetical protein [Pseudomonas sp. RIT-PI-AD]|uniref:hypothetical protein n=1 Tax=Pseudomonas sp. RIT-PI-AD TaxID=3035294 RepID=UPI0021DAB324|nr:hypothetical protein [Pseudomonas sp. RIT-PI-AD]